MAVGASSSAERVVALESLCSRYWPPLYSFARHQGWSAHDAEDLIQDFIAFLLSRPVLECADPSRGRFRSFLLASLKNFMANARAKAHAQKRGGGMTRVSIDFSSAECGLGEELRDRSSEGVFERRWAITVLQKSLETVRSEYSDPSRRALFEALQPCLAGDRTELSYGQIGDELGMTEGAVKVAVHRLRRRYREALRAEVASTLAREEDLEDELRTLTRLVSAGS